jgi:3',5'-cyclic AMP phosphodiesterase CpdA
MTTQAQFNPARRGALKCLAFGGAGTLFTLSAGILTPVDLALARAGGTGGSTQAGLPLFLQISDTHIGFDKEANPDVVGTLTRTIAMVNAMSKKPALVIHTGDITHLSKASEFDTAAQLMSQLNVPELHTTPGEHDVADASVTEYFNRYGKASQGRGYYSFDHHGVHFVSLINVLNFKPNGLGNLGQEQLEWLEKDLRERSASTPIVVFAHLPLWTVYAPWGWGTADADQAMRHLSRFGSVTVLNGHIHQIVQKVEGNITFHTARSTAYPQPAPGEGPGPGPLKVPTEALPRMLGVSNVTLKRHPDALRLTDTTLA